jgi:hypothetical protein
MIGINWRTKMVTITNEETGEQIHHQCANGGEGLSFKMVNHKVAVGLKTQIVPFIVCSACGAVLCSGEIGLTNKIEAIEKEIVKIKKVTHPRG